MQNLSNNIDLEEIQKLAGLFYTPREIAIILQLIPEDFITLCNEEGCPIYNSFHAGRLLSETELRTSIIKLAKSGSSPAQTMAMNMLMNSKIKLIDK